MTARPKVDSVARSDALEKFVHADESRPLAFSDKAAGSTLLGRSSASLATSPVALSTLSMPMLTIEAPTLQHNIDIMQAWCDSKGVAFAPHGKTVMAPRIWRDQMDAGAWGITVANEAQLRVAVGSGVPRIHLANTLLSPTGLLWLSDALAADPGLVVHFWVDSIVGIELIDSVMRARPEAMLRVLVEVGTPGGRTGVRTLEQAIAVASAVSESASLSLVGVSGYEGAVHAAQDQQIAAIDAYLSLMVLVHDAVSPNYSDGEAYLSAGGSSYFDRVVAVLGDAASSAAHPTRVMVRSGAYAVHDDGIYVRNTPSVRGGGPKFVASVHAWAAVISTPEPGLAILNAGRRDVPFDQGLPTPQELRKRNSDGSLGKPSALDATVSQLNDQHAFMHFDPELAVDPGDIVRLGISHPCTAFDKWRSIPVVRSASNVDPLVRGYITTYF